MPKFGFNPKKEVSKPEPSPELLKAEKQWDLEIQNPNLGSDKLERGFKKLIHMGIVYKSGEICFNAATDVLYMEKLRSFTMRDSTGNENRYNQIQIDQPNPSSTKVAKKDFNPDIYK